MGPVWQQGVELRAVASNEKARKIGEIIPDLICRSLA